ncbi:MAG: serine hydrolase [Gammaproteobacteria bacterium]
MNRPDRRSRRRRGFRFAAALGLALSLPVAAAPPVDKATLDAGLDAIVAGEVAGSPELAGLQVLVLGGGEVAYEYAGGFARLVGADRVPMGPEHRMRVASISKLVVALGLMRLVEAGIVDLDADVSGYLGFVLRNPNFPEDAITLRMLLSHTSSIRDGGYYWLEAGERFADFFMPGRPHYEDGAHFASGPGRQPGVWFTYANLNFGVVAAVIERASRMRFDQYIRRELLQPLGLEARFNVCDLSAVHPEHIATLYRKRTDDEIWQPGGDWVAQLDDTAFACHYGRAPVPRGAPPGDILPGYVPGTNPTLFSPQGGLRASARDLAVIARMLLADGFGGGGRFGGVRILDATSVRAMRQPQWVYDAGHPNGDTGEGPASQDAAQRPLFTRWGLSMQLVDLADWGLTAEPRPLAGHLGEAYGLLGQFWLDFETGDGLIALISGAADDPDRHPGQTPLYRPSEEIMRWWLQHFPRGAPRPRPDPPAAKEE